MVGFAVKLDPFTQTYKHFNNYSLYCNDGTFFAETRDHVPYMQKINRGQRVKCYLNLDEGKIFFEVEGQGVNPPINVNAEIVRDSKLFFTVHMHTNQDSVRLIEAPVNPQE